MKHEVGDYFSLEQPYGSVMLYLEEYQDLLGLPGVYLVIIDNCMFGEQYRHRQAILTNAPWLVKLSRDCAKDHRHLDLGFGATIVFTQRA